MKCIHKICIRNDLSEIERVNKIIDAVTKKLNIKPKIIFSLHLTIDELITNIISYGYPDDQTHEIDISLIYNKDNIGLIIEDKAQPFNPLEIPDPDIDQSVEKRKIGGLGIYLVKELMDSMEYKYEAGKNILKIIKKL